MKSVKGQNHASIDKVCPLDGEVKLELEDVIEVEALLVTDELPEDTELEDNELEAVSVDVELDVELLLCFPVVEK